MSSTAIIRDIRIVANCCFINKIFLAHILPNPVKHCNQFLLKIYGMDGYCRSNCSVGSVPHSCIVDYKPEGNNVCSGMTNFRLYPECICSLLAWNMNIDKQHLFLYYLIYVNDSDG